MQIQVAQTFVHRLLVISTAAVTLLVAIAFNWYSGIPRQQPITAQPGTIMLTQQELDQRIAFAMQSLRPSEVTVKSVSVLPTATSVAPVSQPNVVGDQPNAIGGRQLPTTITIGPNTKLADLPSSWISDPIDIYSTLVPSMDQKIEAQIKSGQKVNYLSAKWSLFKVDDITDILEKSMSPRARGSVLESTQLFFWLQEAVRGVPLGYVTYGEMMHRIDRIDRLLNMNDLESQYRLAAARAIINSPR